MLGQEQYQEQFLQEPTLCQKLDLIYQDFLQEISHTSVVQLYSNPVGISIGREWESHRTILVESMEHLIGNFSPVQDHIYMDAFAKIYINCALVFYKMNTSVSPAVNEAEACMLRFGLTESQMYIP